MIMTKIAINKPCGGFRLTEKAFSLYIKKGGKPFDSIYIKKGDKAFNYMNYDDIRDCPILIETIEECPCEGIYIIEIPDNVEWQIDNYDGSEWVAEKHRTWPLQDDYIDGKGSLK